jgi:hypothetical protein
MHLRRYTNGPSSGVHPRVLTQNPTRDGSGTSDGGDDEGSLFLIKLDKSETLTCSYLKL